MGKASRDKGKRGERAARNEMKRLFPGAVWQRGQQNRGDADSPDVEGVIGYGLNGVIKVRSHIEVKSGNTYKLGARAEAAIAQAIKDSKGRPVIVLTRVDRGPWRAVIPLADLPSVCKALDPLTKGSA